MGVDNLVEDEQLNIPDSTTILQLKMRFGEEAVRRGVQYMASLKKADEEYRRSANPDDLDEGWERGYGVENVETDASEEWAESMEEEGLGIDE